jgi:thioredoxin 1
MTFSTPIHTNEQSFERVLAAGLPLLLVWTRKDCAPCAALDPALNRLASAFEGRVLIAKINSDENPKLTAAYQITATPSLIFIRSGDVVGRASGALSSEQLQPALAALAAGAPLPMLPQGQHTPLPGAPAQASSGASAAPLKLTDTSFEATIKGDKPVLVDFWAAWCGPCRMIAPAVETLAKEFAGRAVVAKLNIDENPRTAQRYNVMSIPTLLVFKGGKVVEQIVGVQPLPALRQALARHVPS